ncbi:MAG: hypothetical protein Q8P97_02515 [bacterium]|nr:hypothetical protein [bacterium]
MDWRIFSTILGMGILLVVVQGVASYFDGFLTQSQLRSRGIRGWSFMQHGGMWADVFVISPIVAYTVGRYRLEFFSKWGLVILGFSVVLSLAAGYMYQQGGIRTPEAHTHHGVTTVAGWIHGLFAVAAIWVCGMVYLNLTSPPMSRTDLVVISVLLTPFFYLGVAKFSEHWVFKPQDKVQVAVSIAAVWVVTGIRLWYTKG